MAERLHHRPQGILVVGVCLAANVFVSFLASEPWHSQFSGMTLDEIRAETIPENPGHPDHQAQNPVRLTRVALVGDRGMLTSARIDKELRPAALDWISALRAPQIKALVQAGALQLSLFDDQNLVQITHPDYPGERLVCCHNPALAQERARKRDELLAATEKELDKIAAATRRDKRPLRGRDKIALRN